ncbi:ATP-binding protein [Paraburkholderia caribensis]|uniref:ATP-binding protein n=1 Tax=Paraburkholderia caribensis TaxID=75105 RepID=UPI0034D22559
MTAQYPAGLHLSFGETTVIPARREIMHQGNPVSVGGRAFDLLLLLLERPGTIVSKEQIVEAVWMRRVVGDNALEAQMSILRRALSRDRAAIKTIAGRGYQFIGDLHRASFAGPPMQQESPDPPRLRSPTQRLPSNVTRLVGRDTQLTEITTLLHSRRLLTLVGTGGVGKSRLALEAARIVASSFGDAVHLVELAALGTGSSLHSVFAQCVGIEEIETANDFEKVASCLSDQRFLLLVDNCEHLIDQVATLVEIILHTAPSAVVLATSREPLRIAGEYVYRVPSLEVPEDEEAGNDDTFSAIQLLRERIGFDLTSQGDEGAKLLAQVCRRLDGIPLAIELAAACVPTYGIKGVADRLTDRFQLLKYGARTALPRQQTLRATVDWSYDLLPDGLKNVLNRLSLFAGTFTLYDAQQLLSGSDTSPEEVTTALFELVNKSLVSVIPQSLEARYRLLETIRAYAQNKLSSGGTHREWRARHTSYLVHLCSGHWSTDSENGSTKSAQLSEPSWPDLHSAFAWSFSPEGDPHLAVELTLASVGILTRAGMVDDCLAYVSNSIKLLPTLPIIDGDHWSIDRYAAILHTARAACLLFQNASDSLEALNVISKLAEEIHDPDYKLRSLWGRWLYAHQNGQDRQSLSVASSMAEFALEFRSPPDSLTAKRLMAIAHLYLGDIKNASAQLEKICEQTHCCTDRIRFLYDEHMLTRTAYSQSLSLLGAHQEACEQARIAWDTAITLKHNPSLCYALSEAVCPAALLLESDRALEDAVHALVDATRCHETSTWKLRANMWQGFLALRSGDTAAYESRIAPSLKSLHNARYSLTLTPFIAETAITLAERGLVHHATTLIARAIAWAQRTEGRLALPELRRAKVEVALHESNSEDTHMTKLHLLAIVATSRKLDLLAWSARATRSLTNLMERTGRRRGAISEVRSAFEEEGDSHMRQTDCGPEALEMAQAKLRTRGASETSLTARRQSASGHEMPFSSNQVSSRP